MVKLQHILKHHYGAWSYHGLHFPTYSIFYWYRTQISPFTAMDEDGKRQHKCGSSRQNPPTHHNIYADNVGFRFLRILRTRFSTSWRNNPHPSAWLLISSSMSGIRNFCIWSHAIAKNVHVNMLLMVSCKLLSLRSHISRIRHGLHDTVYGAAIPITPSLHALPNVCIQRLPSYLRMGQHHGPAIIRNTTITYHTPHKDGYAKICLHTISHEKNRLKTSDKRRVP